MMIDQYSFYLSNLNFIRRNNHASFRYIKIFKNSDFGIVITDYPYMKVVATKDCLGSYDLLII